MIRAKSALRYLPGSRLPLTKELAETFGLSLVTVKKVIGEIFFSFKFLSAHYNVSPATVQKAFALLDRAGRAVRVGKRYRAGTFAESLRSCPEKNIACYHDPRTDPGTLFSGSFMGLAYRKMQEELVKQGVTLYFKPLHNSIFSTLTQESGRHAINGMLLCQITTEMYSVVHETLSRYILSCKKRFSDPVKVVIDWERCSYGNTPRETVHFQRGHASTAAARALSRFLANHCMRSVWFFTELNDTIWGNSWLPSVIKTATELKGLHAGMQLHYAVKLLPHSENTEADVRSDLDTITTGLKDDRWFLKYGKQSISSIRKSIEPCFDYTECFRLASQADAWVFSRDGAAHEALKWARENGRRVPEDLAIIGLENDPLVIPAGITTCVPDWETVGYIMAHALVNDMPIAKTHKGFIQTQAHIFERITTSRQHHSYF